MNRFDPNIVITCDRCGASGRPCEPWCFYRTALPELYKEPPMELPKGIAKHMVVETPPDPQPVPVDPNSSYSVYASPEFKAFCKALGIAHGLLTHDLVIVLERDAPVRVYQCYRPDPKRQVVETTSHGTDTPTG